MPRTYPGGLGCQVVEWLQVAETMMHHKPCGQRNAVPMRLYALMLPRHGKVAICAASDRGSCHGLYSKDEEPRVTTGDGRKTGWAMKHGKSLVLPIVFTVCRI